MRRPAVEVELEPARKPLLDGVEIVNRRSGVAGSLEQFGQHGDFTGEIDLPTMTNDVVADRVHAREHGGVRWSGRDARCEAVLEAHPTGSESVDGRAGGFWIAIAT